MCVYQIQYLRDREAAPITRDYMGDDEARLAAKAGPPPTYAASGSRANPLADRG
jgi:hypothetical protein